MALRARLPGRAGETRPRFPIGLGKFVPPWVRRVRDAAPYFPPGPRPVSPLLIKRRFMPLSQCRTPSAQRIKNERPRPFVGRPWSLAIYQWAPWEQRWVIREILRSIVTRSPVEGAPRVHIITYSLCKIGRTLAHGHHNLPGGATASSFWSYCTIGPLVILEHFVNFTLWPRV